MEKSAELDNDLVRNSYLQSFHRGQAYLSTYCGEDQIGVSGTELRYVIGALTNESAKYALLATD